MTRATHPARIAIVGANFAGLRTALGLHRRHQVTVVDPSPHVEFLPNIHELLSGFKVPGALRLSRGSLVERAGHAFVRARVHAIEPGACQVVVDGGRRLDFDVLVVAIGGVGTTFGVPGADVHAMPFKTVDHCAAIGERLRMLVASKARPKVVIVGGGLEGVEALGEILRAYRSRIAIALVESRARVLAEVQVDLEGEIRRRCAGLPVRLVTGRRVAEVEPGRVVLTDGEVLPADVVIWTGGLSPPPLLAASELAPADGWWAPVRATLQSTHHDHLFVVGDAAELPTPVVKQAYHALDMGTHAAGNVERVLRGRRPEPFTPSDKPMLVSFGDLDSYLIAGNTVLAGPSLGAAKEAVFQMVMSRLDTRLGVRGARPIFHRSMRGLLASTSAQLGTRSLGLRLVR